MPKQVETTRNQEIVLPDEAAALLATRILADRELSKPGGASRLPNERQLALDLGVSRTAVRHALSILEAEGKVARYVGRGTFVRSGVAAPSGRVPGERQQDTDPVDIGPADVMAVRALVEPQAMALVVAWATSRDFEEMDRCLAGGDASETYEEFEAWDLALHRCIIAASHNQLLMGIYEAVQAARKGQLWGELKRQHDSRERRDGYRGDHKELVEALRARNTNRAVEAIRAHIGRVENDLFGPLPR